MLELGLGEAMAIETKRKQAHFEAVEAAIGSAFSKGKVGRIYDNSLKDVLHSVDSGRRQARGQAPTEAPNHDVEEVQRMLGRGRRKR